MGNYRIGVDLVEVKRLKKLLSDHPKFLGDIFTAQEVEYCRKKHYSSQHFAARFAVKEAVLKALEVGWLENIEFNEIETRIDNNGKPSVHLSGSIKEKVEKMNINQIEVSLTHTKDYALANILILYSS